MALLVHDLLVEAELRDSSSIDLVVPLPAPIPPSPDASAALLTAFEERGIGWHPDHAVTSLDPDRKVAVLSDGSELAFDLFLGVPQHVAPAAVASLCVDGWIPVDPLTLQTRYPDVYAVGDVTSVGTPKAGVFSEGQATVVADAIIARHRGEAPTTQYDGNGICYVEFGHGQVAKADVTFHTGERPTGQFEGPSPVFAADKADFGATRVRRWFGG